MVSDAFAGDGVLGMMQPLVPRREDNLGPAYEDESRPELYSVGCLGRLEEVEDRLDGQIGIVLNGWVRFRIVEELEEQWGYRRVMADYSEFLHDLDADPEGPDPARLLAAVRKVSTVRGIDFDLELLNSLPGDVLVNALSTAFPFAPVERQALLEAPTLDQREELLFHLLMMGLKDPEVEGGLEPRSIN